MNSYAKNIAERVASGELQIITEFTGEFSWLSNFYWHYSMPYTVEHKFQAGKAKDDPNLFRVIIDAESPGKAKKLGRQAKLPTGWSTRRHIVMRNALLEKFSDPPMRDWLLATMPIPLVEGNHWHDNYWGDCLCEKCSDIPGNNKLGLELMYVRAILAGDQPSYDKLAEEFAG